MFNSFEKRHGGQKDGYTVHIESNVLAYMAHSQKKISNAINALSFGYRQCCNSDSLIA